MRIVPQSVGIIHFIGIGGSGMSGIAEILLSTGIPVTGSDLNESATVLRLRELGASIVIGHRPEAVGNATCVVISTAVAPNNCEVIAARLKRIPVIARAEMLAELMRLKFSLAVAGSHGKTTTTSMVATVLNAAGLDPTAVVGGKVNVLGSNAKLGKSELMVVEADESDGSFLKLHPSIAVVTNIDPEHMDHYKSLDALKAAFVEFCNRVPFFGMSALCLDNAGVQEVIPQLTKRFTTFGVSAQATYRARNIRHEGLITRFVAWRKADELGEVVLPMPGHHNVLNALGVLAVSDFLDIPFATYASAIAKFEGIQRRFTVRGEVGGITVVDDFGHHPAEVRATLSGARASFAGRRIVAAFQPHRFTRTRDQFAEFARSFYDADKVVVCDVFAAGEKPIDGITSEALVKAIKEAGHKDVTYVARREDVAAWMAEQAKGTDLLITLGAGNIQLSCNEVIELLEKTRGAATRKNLVRI